MNHQELSDQEVMAALEAWKSQQAQMEQVNSQSSASNTTAPTLPRGKPSLTEILAQEGLIDTQENTGQLDPTVLQVILDL
jgi:hypothetical protein